MVDESLRGTGDVFARIPIGEWGEIVVRDDGDDDAYTSVLFDGNGSLYDGSTFGNAVRSLREEYGDAAVLDALDGITVRDDDTDTGGSVDRITRSPYVCDGCNRTWPGKSNQTPDADEDTCPDCADSDDE